VELSEPCGGAALSAAVSLLAQAQMQGEPVAWVATSSSVFYPPDVAAAGIDLTALAVIHPHTLREALRATDHLLRSGGFGVVVLDLGNHPPIRMAAQSRLAAQARAHRSVWVCLTRNRTNAPSVGSLVSLRAEVRVECTGFDRFTWTLHAIKDKRRGPGWTYQGTCRGPEGLHA